MSENEQGSPLGQRPSAAAPSPPPQSSSRGRGVLIFVSIVVGLLFACAVLPLGLFALVLAFDGGTTPAATGPREFPEQVVSGRGPDRVVVIDVVGTIGVDDAAAFSAQPTQRQLLAQIRQAREDALVKALVVRVNSGGGTTVASAELHDALREFTTTGKPLVVSMGTVAASGGYYIAAPADRIYANADTLTGSLGVILTLTNFEETFDMIGLRTFVYKSGELKDIGSPTREPTPEEQAVLQGIVDEAYGRFVDVIVEGRNLPRDRVIELADGRIYTGQQALEAQLIDALGNLDDAITGAKELAGLPEEALVVRYRTTETLASLLLSSMRQQQQQAADPLGVRSLTNPPPPRLEYRWIP